MVTKMLIAVTTLTLLVASLDLTSAQAQETEEKQLLNAMMPKILLNEYASASSKDGYNFNYSTSDGSVREEVGIIMNPGTDKEELVVMGAFGYEEGGTRTVTMYTSDKNGYRPRVSIKNRKLNPKLLASLAG